MFNLKSVGICLMINAPIYLLAYFNQNMMDSYNNLLVFTVLEIGKNYTITKIMDKLANKELINKSTSKFERTENKEKYPGEFFLNLSAISSFKASTQLFIYNNMTIITPFNPIYFIIKSFLFELIFDFFHYWTHRLAHSNVLIYKWIHKKHHAFSHPNADTTFYMSVPDILLTHCLPLCIAIFLVPMNQFEFILQNIYLSYQEIGGHLGKRLYPTSSFPQAIWIPRVFNIELYTEDHDLHHSKIKCNYSKRFTLWDKVFNTYLSGINNDQNNDKI